MANPTEDRVRIAMLGFGVVGGGVVELLKPYEHIISLVKICVRDVGKSRDVALPDGCEVVTDAQCIFDDASIDIVIEVMGGTDTAWTYTKHAMEAGKHIVTANKALISKYMDAIEKLALENNVQFLYEAAVCGGIPIVNTALRGLRADTFNHISGIMNGSTNYILSRMEHEGVSYDEVINDARRLGYLEADPSADLEGYDARSKICILARIAFGVTVSDESLLYTAGITHITSRDFEYAKSRGYTIKLIARAQLLPGTDDCPTLECWVSPALVPLTNSMAKVGHDEVIRYIGAGAGRYPTANSVVSDVLEAVDNCNAGIGFASPYGRRQLNCEVASDVHAIAYARVGNKKALLEVLEEKGVEIEATPDDVIMTKSPVSLTQLQQASPMVLMPVLA